MRSWPVELENGQRLRVVAPPVLGDYRGHPAVLADLLRAYHDDLLQAVDGREVWPFREAADPYLQLSSYYAPIGDILGVEPGRMTSLSRHRLFLANESIERRGGLIRGLSGVELLLGYGYPPETSEERPPGEPEASSDPVEEARTGSADLDALTMALLVFKDNGLGLARSVDAESLHQVMVYANAQLKASQEERSPATTIKTEVAEALPELTGTRSVQDKLASAGIPMPQKF